MDAKTIALLILTLCTAIFGFFIRKAIRNIYNFLWLKRNGVMAEGTIVDKEKVTDYDDIEYHPIIEFKTEDHIKVRFTSAGSSTQIPQIGEQLVILYDKNNPSRAEVFESKMLWNPFFMVLFLSALLIYFWIKVLTAKTFVWRDSSMDCILPIRSFLF